MLESTSKNNIGIDLSEERTIEIDNNNISYCLKKRIYDELELNLFTSPRIPDKNDVFPRITTIKKNFSSIG